MQYSNQILIAATPDQVASALADPNQSKEYYYGFEIHSDWHVGSIYEYKVAGNICITGTIKELVPGSKIVMSFKGLWSPKVAKDAESTVTWELEEAGENTLLSLTHSDLVEGTYTAMALPRGWVNIVSSLKTYLETGKGMVIDMSAMMD